MDGVHWLLSVHSGCLITYVILLFIIERGHVWMDCRVLGWTTDSNFNLMWLQLFTVDHGPAAHGELLILH
jgi:hypothetical protein